MGYRVKAAREANGWTQDQLAQALGLKDRQSVSYIENGQRALKRDELLALVDLLKRDLDFFIDPFAVVGEAHFSWRVGTKVSMESLDVFEHKASSWIGLLRWLRAQAKTPPNPLKRNLRLGANSRNEDASACAEALVASLSMGSVPALRMVECMERDLDIPVLFVDADHTAKEGVISAATCQLHDLDVVLVNRLGPSNEIFVHLTRELFHALAWDAMPPEHRVSNALVEQGRLRRTEQMANHFAAAFLMPTASLDTLIASNLRADVAHLNEVAHHLRVPPSSLAWRLFSMKRINEVTRDALIRRRFAAPEEPAPARFSIGFVTQLHSALDRGQISARKAAKAVGVNLSELKGLFEEHALASPFDL